MLSRRLLLPGSLIVFLLLLSAIVGGCSAPTTISRADYGDDWPFLVDEVQLRCAGFAVWVVHEGLNYPLNGPAQQRLSTGQPLHLIWASDPEIPGAKISIGPIIQEGLARCE